MFSTGQCYVTLVSQRGDNQSWTISQVFVTVSKAGISLLYKTIINLGVPVVSELFWELEIVEIVYPFVHELGYDVSGVHVQYNQGAH